MLVGARRARPKRTLCGPFAAYDGVGARRARPGRTLCAPTVASCRVSRPTMIFRAAEEPVEIPEMALTPFLLRNVEARGDKAALIDASSGRKLTYRAWAGGGR